MRRCDCCFEPVEFGKCVVDPGHEQLPPQVYIPEPAEVQEWWAWLYIPWIFVRW